MTDPTFFTEGGWTGYLSSTVPTHFKDGFFGLGARQRDAIRFNVTEQGTGPTYKVLSEEFRTENETLQQIRIIVNKKTGQLRMRYWPPMPGRHEISEGVITPFGIVTSLHRVLWLWLWKVEWSAADR